MVKVRCAIQPNMYTNIISFFFFQKSVVTAFLKHIGVPNITNVTLRDPETCCVAYFTLLPFLLTL